MSQKLDRAAALLGRIPAQWEAPKPLEKATLLEQGLLCVLTRHFSRPQAEATIKSLEQAFKDWNELRIAQVQEIVPHIPARKNGAGLIVARDVKEYLQEVFQRNHGFDLEFLRGDLSNASKFLSGFSFLGAAACHYLLWIAGNEDLPVSAGLVRTLDRLGLIGRTSSLKKAKATIEPLVPKDRTLEFAIAFGTVVERWCDAKRPICWECPLVTDCPHGKKVQREWKQQQERLVVQRHREEARAVALHKKEEARNKREEERRRRDAERAEQKLARERERREKAEAKKRLEDERRREREAAQKEALRKRASKKEVKKAPPKKDVKASKKKPAAKPSTRKKATKPVTKKKPTTSKKSPTSGKKSTSKPATRGKATGRKKR